MIAEGGNELNSGDQASEDSDNDDGAIQSFAVSATAALATLYFHHSSSKLDDLDLIWNRDNIFITSKYILTN